MPKLLKHMKATPLVLVCRGCSGIYTGICNASAQICAAVSHRAPPPDKYIFLILRFSFDSLICNTHLSVIAYDSNTARIISLRLAIAPRFINPPLILLSNSGKEEPNIHGMKIIPLLPTGDS